LRRNCTALVHSSFGSLKANFSADEAVQILKDIVGGSGNVLMPYYPGNGAEWLASRRIFDPSLVPTTTGILAQVFARSPGVQVSDHPIKAVAAWGRDRDFLIAQHCLSKTPYDGLSPYAKLLSLPHCRIIGLGTLKMSFFHCCEDSIPGYADTLYTAERIRGTCRRSDGETIDVWTRVHRPEVLRSKPSSAQFLADTMCPAYKVVAVRGRSFYTAEARGVYEHVRGALAGDIRSQGV
jgi:aminoglycoside N3'-acetyltransferase